MDIFETDIDVDVDEKIDIDNINSSKKAVFVFDDSFNSFEHVIRTLIAICNMSVDKANNTTITIHTKGKCIVFTHKEETVMMETVIQLKLEGLDARLI